MWGGCATRRGSWWLSHARRPVATRSPPVMPLSWSCARTTHRSYARARSSCVVATCPMGRPKPPGLSCRAVWPRPVGPACGHRVTVPSKPLSPCEPGRCADFGPWCGCKWKFLFVFSFYFKLIQISKIHTNSILVQKS
jgi:hypothetical protein